MIGISEIEKIDYKYLGKVNAFIEDDEINFYLPDYVIKKLNVDNVDDLEIIGKEISGQSVLIIKNINHLSV